MWQRFTERARRAMFFAHEEAKCRGVWEVDTPHLMLGILAESEPGPTDTEAAEAFYEIWPPPPRAWRGRDSIAVRVLKKLGVDSAQLRIRLEASVPLVSVADVAQDVSEMHLSSLAKLVIDTADDEAKRLKNKYIGTEHLLLGLICEKRGVAGRVLAEQGVTLERARQEVMKLQGYGSHPAPDVTPSRPWWRLFG